MESFRNPRLMEDQILSAILKDVGCNSKDQVTIFASNDVPTMPLSKSAMLQAKTLRIGNDIIRSASKYVRDELHNAIKNVRQKAPPDIPDEELRVICDIDSDVIFWRSALFRIEGEDPNIPWKYFIAKSPVANAFVTEILPQVRTVGKLLSWMVSFFCFLALTDISPNCRDSS